VRICVAGWYFKDRILRQLEESKYQIFIVAHREYPEEAYSTNLAYDVIPNVGLEFGCYDWYLKHIWSKPDSIWSGGDVLFIHDDNEINEKSLDLIADLNRDQVFLFNSEEEAQANGYAHGRAMYCSEAFLHRLKADGGFWYDEGNTGDVRPTTAEGPNYHNAGILTFRAYLKSLPATMSVGRYSIVPGLKCGYRGRI
jgi:hypothetical protein